MRFAIDKLVFENKMRNLQIGEMIRWPVAGKTLTLTIMEVLSDLRIPLRCDRMANNDEAEQRRRMSGQTVILILVVVISIVAAGWTLVTVSTRSEIPSSDLVSLPTTPLSSRGEQMMFVEVTTVAQKGVAVGVRGYLRTVSGAPVAGATVYFTYFLDSKYRTQAATTDQNGCFQVYFPMNWTGWLPLSLTYFGDEQHQGLEQQFSVSGENL